MQYFLVEGHVTHPEKINPALLAEHKAYTSQLMAKGDMLFSSLRSNNAGSVNVVRAKSLEEIQAFYHQEPFYLQGVLTYTISPLQVHYHALQAESWFAE